MWAGCDTTSTDGDPPSEGNEGTMAELTLTDANFDESINGSDTPVLVDFWAEWCVPCQKVAPVLAEIGAENAGKITIAKLNIDHYPQLAQRFGVMSIPTMIVFDEGQEALRLVGGKAKGQLLTELSDFL
jgi:thioredoxin 1